MNTLNFGIYAVLLPINIIGNSIVCVFFKKAKDNVSITNYLLLNLAAADLLFGCVVLVCKIVVSLFVASANDFYCKVVGTSLYLSCGVSVFTLMVIALERYYAIMKPALHRLRTRDHRNRKYVHLTWVITLVVVTPLAAFLENIEFAEQHVVACGFVNSRNARQIGPIYDAFVVLIVFLVPNLVIFCLYGRIVFKLWFCPKFSSKSNKVILKSRRSLTRMLLIVTAVFTICWFPYYVRTFRALVARENSYVLSVVCRLLVSLNTCANPVIYTLYSPRFRRELKRLCCCQRGRPRRKIGAIQAHASPSRHATTAMYHLSLQHLPYLIDLNTNET